MKPDYARAGRMAEELLLEYPYPHLPIDVFHLAGQFKDLRLRSYTWFGEKNGLSLGEVCRFAQSDCGVCYFLPHLGKHLILYNDRLPSFGRIRWTVSHELGHFILRHNERYEVNLLHPCTLFPALYDQLEKEANCFARALLAPYSLFSALGLRSPQEVACAFGLSGEAAEHIWQEYARRDGRAFSAPILAHFSAAIAQYTRDGRRPRAIEVQVDGGLSYQY